MKIVYESKFKANLKQILVISVLSMTTIPAIAQ